MTGVRIRLRSSFRFLWTAQRRIYSADGRVCNRYPVRFDHRRRVSVDIVERPRNATGTTHSGNSAAGRTVESVRMSVSRSALKRAVTLAHGSPPGTGTNDGRGGIFLR